MGYAVAIRTELTFETIECCSCGVLFAVLDDYKSNLQKTTRQFYCPNGHPQSYTESTADQLRKQLEAKDRALAEKEQALTWEKERTASLDKQLRKEQKAAARLKRRVAAGVCPCCQRTVSQLSRHMATKHPDFVDEQAKR